MMQQNLNNPLQARQTFHQMFQLMEVPMLLINGNGVVECFNNQFVLQFYNGIIEQGKTPVETILNLPESELVQLKRHLTNVRSIGRMNVKSRVKGFSNQHFELLLTPISLCNTTYHLGQLTQSNSPVEVATPNITEFQLLAENSNDLLCLLDKKGVFVYTSPSISTMLGYHHNELTGVHPITMIHPDDTHRMEQNHRLLHKNGSTPPINYRFRHKDGHDVWVETSMQIAEATPLNPMRIIATTRDISDRMAAWKAQLAAEEALLASELRYRILTEVTNEGIVIHRNGIMTDINPAMQSMMGVQVEDYRGRSILDFIHPDSKELVAKQIQSNYTGIYQITILRNNGTSFEAELMVKTLTINDETYRVVTVNDISDRIKREKQIRESEERFRGIFDNAITGIAFADEKGRVLLSNNAFNSTLGYSADEINGMMLCNMVLCEQQGTCAHSLIDCLRDGQSAKYVEKILIKKSGAIAWVNLSVSMIPATERTPSYMVAVIQDITTKKKSELDLIEALDYNRTINQTSPVGIITTNAQGNITFANHKAEHMLGLTRSAKMPNQYQTPHWHLQTNEGAPYGDELLPYTQVKNTHQPVHAIEIAIQWNNHKRTYLSVNAAPILRDGKFTGMIATIEDISEKIKNEQALLQSNDKLKELNATKDKFFSIIAHDLRNPLANLFSLTDLLHRNYKEYDQSTTTELIQLLYDNSSRTFTLLENLLTWSRSQTNAITFTPTSLSLHHLVDDTIMLLSSGVIQKNIALINGCDKKLEVMADQVMLSSVLRNLITNAVKFSHPGSSVEIETHLINNPKGMVQLSITDHGTGMSDDVKHNLFKMGRQASHPGTQGEQGTGLGLLLCKEFIEKHGGQLWVESTPDEGSCFYATIPVAQPETSHSLDTQGQNQIHNRN